VTSSRGEDNAMTDILLEQHWYGSAPTGLQLSRGFQVIARSPDLGDDPLLEGHCAYKRPPSLPDKKLPPVNWGWFPLDKDRACIHRVGYSGTDELGRPGNFLAHNLIVRREDLERIDYDVPALIRWVRTRARQRYPLRVGGDDGFARNYKNLYDTYGEDKGKLARVSPLAVPVEEVLGLRKQFDDAWQCDLLAPLRQRLQPDDLAALLHAYLCEPDQRRPILLVIGGDEEDGDFPLEFKIADFLFSLMPFHCRSRLTFCTYSHDPSALLAPPAPGDGPAPHKDLRLVMTTPTNDFAPAVNRAGAVWVVNTHTRRHSVPQPSPLSTRYLGWVQEGRWDTIRRLRDDMHSFAFAEELSGLHDAYELRNFATRPLIREDYGPFTRAARCMRTTANYPEFLATAHHAIAGWRQVAGRDAALLRSLAVGYLHVLRLQYARLSPADRAARRTEVSADLGLLFREALVPDSTAVIGQLLRVVNQPFFAELRPSALRDFAAALEEGVRGRLGSDPARAITANRLEYWADLWDNLREGCLGAERDCQDFLAQASALFCSLLCLAEKRARRALHKAVQTFVLPMLCSTPVPDLAELERRLGLLWDVNPEEGPASCAALLVNLARAGRLPSLDDLATERRDLVLRFFEAFREAMKDPAFQSAPRPLASPKLIPAYWQVPPEDQDIRLHRGFRTLLRAVSRLPDPDQLADVVAKVGQKYLAEGAEQLERVLRLDGPPRSAEEYAELAAAHCDLLELLRPSEDANNDQLLVRLAAHLRDLLAWLLALPGTAIDGNNPDPLAVPLDLFLKWDASRCSLRMNCYRQILGRVIDVRQGFTGDEPALLGRLREALARRLHDAAEAAWLPHALRLAIAHPGTALAQLEVPILACVLEDDPSLADEGGGNRPMRSVCAEPLASPQLWQYVAGRLIHSCADRARLREAVETWFAAKGRCRPLLDGLQQRGLLPDVGQQLTARLVSTENAEAVLESIRRLGDLLVYRLPPELAGPARDALAGLLPRYLDALFRLVQQQRDASPGWVPPMSLADTALTLCRPLAVVGDALDPGWLGAFWPFLGDCLGSLSPSQVRERFPEVFRLGRRVGPWLNKEPDAVWIELFAVLAQPDRRHLFWERFLAAGDSLFTDREGHPCILEGAEHFASLRRAKDKELAACFWRKPRADASAKRGWNLLPSARPGREDALLPALGRVPDAAREPDLSNAAVAAVAARALFAAALYVPKEMDALARVYHALGDTGESWQPRLSALALAAYVRAGGTAPEAVSHRARELFASPFLKPYSQMCNADRPAIVQAFRQWLRWYGIDDATTARVADRLHNKL
jgi:hypothetical protein